LVGKMTKFVVMGGGGRVGRGTMIENLGLPIYSLLKEVIYKSSALLESYDFSLYS
jgi:hypothetical protein